MTDLEAALVRFGAFELDLRTGELRKSGVKIHLSDQPCQVLRALLERPGNLITREDLRQRLWAADTVVDFERGLNAAVRRLREALGDWVDVPRFVETLPRRGYRFIAPVSRQPEPAESEPLVPEIATKPFRHPRSRRPRDRIVPGARCESLAWPWWSRSFSGHGVRSRRIAHQSPPAIDRFMLAVLPFQNMTGDPAQEYISDGMTEELISQLAGSIPHAWGSSPGPRSCGSRTPPMLRTESPPTFG